MSGKKLEDMSEEEITNLAFDGGDMQIYVERPRWFGQPWFLLRKIHPARVSYRYATGLTWSDPIPADSPIVPDDLTDTFRLSHQETQGLFDQLWQMGYRPSDGTSNEGALKATKAHLVDMQRLVFQRAPKAAEEGSND